MKRERRPQGQLGKRGSRKKNERMQMNKEGVCKGPRVGGAAGGLLRGGPVRYALLGNLAVAESRACWRRCCATIGLHGADNSVC